MIPVSPKDADKDKCPFRELFLRREELEISLLSIELSLAAAACWSSRRHASSCRMRMLLRRCKPDQDSSPWPRSQDARRRRLGGDEALLEMEARKSPRERKDVLDVWVGMVVFADEGWMWAFTQKFYDKTEKLTK